MVEYESQEVTGEVEYEPVTNISWVRGDDGEWTGSHSETDSSGATNTTIFDNSYWSGPEEADMEFMYGPGGSAKAPEYSPSVGEKFLEIMKDNPKIAEALVAGGAGLLKNLGQQEMLKEQREWLEKQDKMKWDRTMNARKFAPIEKKQQTGLLATVQAAKARKEAA